MFFEVTDLNQNIQHDASVDSIFILGCFVILCRELVILEESFVGHVTY